MIALGGGALQVAEVGGHAGDAQHAGLLVEDGQHLLDGVAVLVHQVLHDGGVDIARAGAHGYAGQRAQAHCGVHALAVHDGGQGGAVAEVAGDELQPLGVAAHDGGGPGGHIAVGGAVEAVAADLVLLVILVGDGIGIGLLGHGHVEGGVEHGHLRGLGHDLLAGLDAHQVGGIVQGTQGDALLDGLNAGVVDDAALRERHAAVEHAVAHRVDLIHAGDHAVITAEQGGQDGLDRLGVGGHGDLGLELLVLGGDLMGQAAVDADALAQTLRQYIPCGGVHQLILQGRAACVDDEYLHVCCLSFFSLTKFRPACGPDGSVVE